MFRYGVSDFTLLFYRLILALAFIILGEEKLAGLHLSYPFMAFFYVIDLGCGLLTALGTFRSSLPFLLSLYCVVSALLGHNYWDFSAADQQAMSVFFFKSIIMAWCFFILTVTGPGNLSIYTMKERKKSVLIW